MGPPGAGSSRGSRGGKIDLARRKSDTGFVRQGAPVARPLSIVSPSSVSVGWETAALAIGASRQGLARAIGVENRDLRIFLYAKPELFRLV
jgi:hypothetical protein